MRGCGRGSRANREKRKRREREEKEKRKSLLEEEGGYMYLAVLSGTRTQG